MKRIIKYAECLNPPSAGFSCALLLEVGHPLATDSEGKPSKLVHTSSVVAFDGDNINQPRYIETLNSIYVHKDANVPDRNEFVVERDNPQVVEV